MESRLLNEISYLTRLIEQHKKSSVDNDLLRKPRGQKIPNSSMSQLSAHASRSLTISSHNSGTQRSDRSKYSYVKPSLPSPGKVHVNPNFKPKLAVIHLNPRMNAKPSVHINPKLMKDLTAQSLKEKSELITQMQNGNARIKTETSVHINPKLMKELTAASAQVEESTKDVQNKCKNSTPGVVRVATSQPNNNLIVRSKTKLIKNNAASAVVQKRLTNSGLISLSRRKLVRIRRNSKSGPGISPLNPGRIRRLSSSTSHKTTVATKYKLIMTRANNADNINNVSRSSRTRSTGSNKYKIDRTLVQKVKKRLSGGKSTPNTAVKKTLSCSTGLVRIGGILYKSSRNQLVRSNNDSSPSKRKRSVINVKGDRFVMASNGKTLRRISSTGAKIGKVNQPNPVTRVDIGRISFVEKTPNVLVRTHVKTNISAKAKQRSIQILRNKMRKNNQPCLIFQKFGYCAGQVKSTCPKLHDKKQVALCRNFLQGKCLLDNCPLSHAVCPEKMPTCKYFLEGCCIRDECPYLHVKVSSKTPICTQFLRGYCAEAHKCKQRHVYVCPEFDRSGKCSKGKYCPYPHKASESVPRKSPKAHKKISTKIQMNNSATSQSIPLHVDDRKRYYDEAGSTKDNLDKKRQNILKGIEIMKNIKSAELNSSSSDCSNTGEKCQTLHSEITEMHSELNSEGTCPRRTPLGLLPAYIPIN